MKKHLKLTTFLTVSIFSFLQIESYEEDGISKKTKKSSLSKFKNFSGNKRKRNEIDSEKYTIDLTDHKVNLSAIVN